MKFLLLTIIHSISSQETIFFSGPGATEMTAMVDILVATNNDLSMTNHGCFASRLSQHAPFEWQTPSSTPVDEVDQLVKNWFDEKNDLKTNGNVCYPSSSSHSDFYILDENSLMGPCSLNINSCVQKICEVDFRYAKALSKLDYSLISGNEKVCGAEKPLLDVDLDELEPLLPVGDVL